MKITQRGVLVAISHILLTPLVLLVRHFLDLGQQYSAFTYFQTSAAELLFHAPSRYPSPVGIQADDKIVAMARTENEDTDWVARELPSLVAPFAEHCSYADVVLSSWQRAIYTVNPSNSLPSNTTLTTPMNKGHEAMAT